MGRPTRASSRGIMSFMFRAGIMNLGRYYEICL